MDEIEISLNQLSSADEIYAECSEALGTEITESSQLEAFLSENKARLSLKLYISNETPENPAISSIIKAVRDSGVSFTVKEDEFLNLIDSSGHITSEAKPRELVHRDGDLHAAVHIWIIRRCDMGVYALLQKRSHEKKISPDCYDVSAAGHVSQGEELRVTAVRETAEELGLKIHESKLEFLGFLQSRYQEGDTDDNELRAVYLCREPIDDTALELQESEVSEVCWAEIDELLAVIDDTDMKHCIDLRELSMIKKAVF